MNVLAIRKPTAKSELTILDQMHRLRAQVFRGRLSWNVRVSDGKEYDEFDDLAPTYIIALSSSDHVVGCARLLPALGKTMLDTVFPQLMHDNRLDAHSRMVESSRFCVDTSSEEGRGSGSLHSVTLAMFAGIVEWCLAEGYSEIATATDIRFERILNRAGWPLRRLGDPILINETQSVAGLLSVDSETFEKLRPRQYHSTFASEAAKAA